MWQAFSDGHFPYSPSSDYRELRLLRSYFDRTRDTIPALTDTLHVPTHLEALLCCQFEEKWKFHQWSKNAFCGPLLFMLGCSLQGLFWNVLALGFEVFQKKNPGLYLHSKYSFLEERAESFVLYIYPRGTLLLYFQFFILLCYIILFKPLV